MISPAMRESWTGAAIHVGLVAHLLLEFYGANGLDYRRPSLAYRAPRVNCGHLSLFINTVPETTQVDDASCRLTWPGLPPRAAGFLIKGQLRRQADRHAGNR